MALAIAAGRTVQDTQFDDCKGKKRVFCAAYGFSIRSSLPLSELITKQAGGDVVKLMISEKNEQKEQPRKPYITSQPKIYSFLVKPKALNHYGAELGLVSQKEALCALSQAIAHSPLWTEMPRATLVARLVPYPMLAVIGCFELAGGVRLMAQAYEQMLCKSLYPISLKRS